LIVASLGNFDATQVDPIGKQDALPAGQYKCVAIESEWKDTKDGTGKYLQFVFEVVDGQFKGQRVWDRLNLVNNNSQAVEIARRTLSAICHAVNVMQPKDSSQLHNIPLVVKVACKEYNGGFTNEVKGYAKLTGAPVSRPAQAEPVTSGSKAPWE
jgi:hypothetical protein